jgi:hypothetical protein
MKIQRDIRDLPVISILIREEHPAKIVNFFELLTDSLFYKKILDHHHILEPGNFQRAMHSLTGE